MSDQNRMMMEFSARVDALARVVRDAWSDPDVECPDWPTLRHVCVLALIDGRGETLAALGHDDCVPREEHEAGVHVLWAARMWRTLRDDKRPGDHETVLLTALSDVEHVPDSRDDAGHGMPPAVTQRDRAERAEAERDRYREALQRIYQSGTGRHVEIARAALDGGDGDG